MTRLRHLPHALTAPSRAVTAASLRPAPLTIPALAVASLLAGCAGESGTVAIEIVTAPGSTVMDDVTRVRMVLSNPYTVVDAERGSDGSFDLSIDVPANGPSGEILFLGLDDAGTVLAYGRTPPFPIAAVDADIAIYVAPPESIGEAPVDLGVGRSEMGAANLQYGVLLVGGRDSTGEPTADTVVYNAYDHGLQVGEDMPEARARPAAIAGIGPYAYVFGGEDLDGDPRATLWRFDTEAAPDGTWLAASESEDDTLARVGASIAPLGGETFLVTGAPPVLVEGVFVRSAAIEQPATLFGEAATIQRSEEPGAPIYTLIVGEGAGDTGITRLAGGTVGEEENAPADALRSGHAVIPTVRDEIIVVGGEDATGPLRSAIRCDPAARTYQSFPELLTTARADAAVAANATVLIVAGGRDGDGAVLGDAELFDVATLEPLGTLPLLVPRTGAVARALPNQQILIVGGVDADGAPVATLELFTPATPQLPSE